MILLLPSKIVTQAWPVINKAIAEAISFGPDWMHPLMVYEAAVAGMAQIATVYPELDSTRLADLPEPAGVLVLEVKVFPGPKHVAHVWAFGGRPGVWAEHGEEIEEFLDAWSSSQGCDTITLQGRPGWQKLLGDDWQFRPVVEASRPVRLPGHVQHSPAIPRADRSAAWL